jgi:beta-lactamase regulating signal transducer with metallopeptidase domain
MNLTNTVGWTLIHFVWQGAGIAALLGAARHALPNSGAQARYIRAMAAMLLMLASVGATFVYLDSGDIATPLHPPASQSSIAAPAGNIAQRAAATTSWRDRMPDYFPVLVYIWVAGVTALSIRSLGGWVVTQLWKRRNVRLAEAFWQESMARLAKRLTISRKVCLWESATAHTPAVIGWIRPVVLLPASAISGLAPSQIEALLAHELAHIRRHDYLVNLVQTAIETLLFYHPAVWWVGRQMRAERENCCDDLAVAVCGDALVYARALTELEKIRIATPRLVMAANSGSLLQRVRRLLDPQRDPASSPSEIHADWVTGVAIVLCVVSIWATSGGPPRLRLDHAAQSVRLVNALYQQRPEPTASQVDQQVDQQVEQRVIQTPKAKLVAMAQPAAQAEQTAEPSSDKSFVGGIAALGYKDLSVDQLISLKIHGVTTDYVRELLAAGLKLKVDEIVSFAIHGAQPADIVEMQELGYKLTPNEIVSMYIHGLTPEFTRQMKSAGFGTPTFEQLVSFKIHGVTPEIAEQFKQAGVRELNFDKLVSLEIHGANPDTVKQIGALGYPNLTADDVIAMCIHGVDVDFVRKAQKHGFRDLSLDKLIKLKQYGILD